MNDQLITKPFETEEELKLVSRNLKTNAEALSIEGEAGVKEAKALKKQIITYTKDVANKRLDFTRQLNQIKKNAMDLEKEIIADAKDADEIVRAKMLAYEQKRKEEQIARAMELEKAQKIAEKSNASPKFGARTKLIIEITDAEAVPRIFCSPDIAKIREFAKGQNIAELEIPGVKLIEERTI